VSSAAPTPPPHGNFLTTPVVHHGPYEYSSPMVEEDWLPQTKYVEGAEKFAAEIAALGLAAEVPATLRCATLQSDVIVTCTPGSGSID